jgi:hypothetical protein
MDMYFNKKYWEEFNAYFPLIGHGPHRKRRVQLFGNGCAGDDQQQSTNRPMLCYVMLCFHEFRRIHRHTDLRDRLVVSVSYAVRVVSKETRPVVLPRTSCSIKKRKVG